MVCLYFVQIVYILDNHFLHTFILTFRSFTSRNDLIDRLMERFNMPPPKDVTHEEFGHFKKEKLDKVRLRVTQTLKYWLENFFVYDFDAEGLKKLDSVVEVIEKSKYPHLATIIKKTVEKVKSDDSGRVQSKLECPPPMFPKTGLFGAIKKDSPIMKWPLLEIARQITLIDFTIFSKIEPKECLNQAWNKGNRETKAPNIYKMINWFNLLSNWVGSQVVLTEDVEKRSKLMAKFIELANFCKDMNNFNAVFSIISGLNLAAIFRLKETWAALPQDITDMYKDLHQYISRDKNFKTIRTAIRKVKPPCIPYIGLYLTDLYTIFIVCWLIPRTFIEEGSPKYVNEKINFAKCRKFAEVIRDMQTYQNTRYALTEVPELQAMMLAVVPLSEDQQYKESLAREQRTKSTAVKKN